MMTSAISVQSVRFLMYFGLSGLQRREYLGSLKFTTQNFGVLMPSSSYLPRFWMKMLYMSLVRAGYLKSYTNIV